MPAYNDGAIPYGSRIVTIDTVAYIAEDIEVTRPTSVIERRNELNEPSGQVLIQDFVTGSATLQLAATSTDIPDLGATFTMTIDSEIGAETFIISEIGQGENQGEAKKIRINFRKRYNT